MRGWVFLMFVIFASLWIGKRFGSQIPLLNQL